MATVHDYENYYNHDPSQPSKLKRLIRSLGHVAGRAVDVLVGNDYYSSSTSFDAPYYPEGGSETVGRPINLPATYSHENGRKTQSVYSGRIYNKKGKSVIPLDLLREHDMLIAIYNMKNSADRRYLVVQKVPELRTDVSSLEEEVKFSEVYERPQAEERFTCKNRDSTISDPELVRSLIIGGNYGAGARLVAVLGLDPKQEAEFSDDSTQEERSLAYSIYQLERTLLEHEVKINSQFI